MRALKISAPQKLSASTAATLDDKDEIDLIDEP